MVDGDARAVGCRDFAFDPFGLLDVEAVENGNHLLGAGEHGGVRRSAVAVLEVGVVVCDDHERAAGRDRGRGIAERA